MGKLIIIVTIILVANNLKAQEYDIYGRSQATREWQEYERHHASVSSSNKKSSTTNVSGDYNAYGWGDYSGIQTQNEAANRQDARWKEWFDKVDKLEMLIKSRNLKREPAYFYQLQTAAKDAGFNDYDIHVFFGYNSQEYEEKLLNNIKQQNGTGDANRAKAEFAKSAEMARKEKELEQKRKDEQIRVEIAEFSKNWNTALSTDYGIELREKAFIAMNDYLYPIIKSTRETYMNEPKDYLRTALNQGESSMTSIQKNRNIFYTQSKQFELAYRNGNINTRGLSEEEITNTIGNFVYAGLIYNKNPTSVIIEKAAYAYKLDPNKLSHFAYSLFLDNDLDATIDLLQKHIAKYPADTLNRIGDLNKLILLKIYQHKDEEALKIYNSNSSIAITEKSKLVDFIHYSINSTVKKCIAEDEKTNYYIYPASILMDIDLLAVVQPTNENIQELRKKIGEKLNCQRYKSSISELWASGEKKNTNSTTYMEELIANGSMSKESKKWADVIGFPLYVPDKKVYESLLEEALKHNKENGGDTYQNYSIVNGYLLYTRPYWNDRFCKIEDLEMPVLDENTFEIHIALKPFKYIYEPNSHYEGNTTERDFYFSYASKAKAKKGLKLFTALFEKLQMQ